MIILPLKWPQPHCIAVLVQLYSDVWMVIQPKKYRSRQIVRINLSILQDGVRYAEALSTSSEDCADRDENFRVGNGFEFRTMIWGSITHSQSFRPNSELKSHKSANSWVTEVSIRRSAESSADRVHALWKSRSDWQPAASIYVDTTHGIFQRHPLPINGWGRKTLIGVQHWGLCPTWELATCFFAWRYKSHCAIRDHRSYSNNGNSKRVRMVEMKHVGSRDYGCTRTSHPVCIHSPLSGSLLSKDSN
jgi:hypothetical protein